MERPAGSFRLEDRPYFPEDDHALGMVVRVRPIHPTLSGQIYRTKHTANWMEFIAEERSKYPTEEPVYLIQDGLSTHWTPAVRQGAREHEVILVPTATHAKGRDELALPGTEFTSAVDLGAALDRAVEYRNEERKERGRRSRDTVRADRRHASKVPIWLRATAPDVSEWPLH